MKNPIISLIFYALIALVIINQGCKSKDENKTVAQTKDSAAIEMPAVKMGNFYEADSNSNNSVLLADTIIYNVVVKNPDPEDDWQEYSLKYFNRQALANIIFNAIYNGRLTPYSYQYENVMTIDEVKEMEKKHPRSEIANIQFTEKWYFNEKALSFTKKVSSIMMAYEHKNKSGEVRYTAGIQVFLDNKSKNPGQTKTK
jgi:hypothetical protein